MMDDARLDIGGLCVVSARVLPWSLSGVDGRGARYGYGYPCLEGEDKSAASLANPTSPYCTPLLFQSPFNPHLAVRPYYSNPLSTHTLLHAPIIPRPFRPTPCRTPLLFHAPFTQHLTVRPIQPMVSPTFSHLASFAYLF